MNENMNVTNAVEENVDTCMDVIESTGMNAGVAMLVGAGLGIAAVTVGKKLIGKLIGHATKKTVPVNVDAVDTDFEDVGE